MAAAPAAYVGTASLFKLATYAKQILADTHSTRKKELIGSKLLQRKACGRILFQPQSLYLIHSAIALCCLFNNVVQ